MWEMTLPGNNKIALQVAWVSVVHQLRTWLVCDLKRRRLAAEQLEHYVRKLCQRGNGYGRESGAGGSQHRFVDLRERTAEATLGRVPFS